MTSIFRDGRGFVPTTVFTPQFFESDVEYHLVGARDKPNLIEKTLDNITNDPASSLDTLKEIAHSTFQRLFKTDDDTPTISVSDSNSDFKKTFDQLVEKRIYQKAESDYNEFIAKRENKIKAEQERLQKLDEYNQELVNKVIESKAREAEKKRQKEKNLDFLKGILCGDDDDPSIPKLILGILKGSPPEFFKIWTLKTSYIEAINKISPVEFGHTAGYYKNPPEVSIECCIRPRKHMIFLGVYRRWTQQFVRRIIEKRQRGPPLNNGHC